MADGQREWFPNIMTGLCFVATLLGVAALLGYVPQLATQGQDKVPFGVVILVGSGVVLLALWLARNLPPPRQTDDNEKETAR